MTAVRGTVVGLAALVVAGAFVLSAGSFLTQIPTLDSWMAIWLARELPWWQPLVDPLSAGYTYLFFFEPLFVPVHVLAVHLQPLLGDLAFHLVSVVGVTLMGGLMGWWLLRAGTTLAVAVLVPAVFLLSPPSWYTVAESSAAHYTLATLLGLVALWPAVACLFTGASIGWRGALFAAVAYGLACVGKESVAGLPIVFAGLLVAAQVPVGRTIGLVLPQVLALIPVLIWKWTILGGLGGYFFAPPLTLENLYVAPAMLFQVNWGRPLIAVGLLVLAIWCRPRVGVALLAVVLGTVAPFVLMLPFEPTVYFAFRLLLFWALFLLLVGWAVAARPGWAAVFSLAAVGLIALQWPQRQEVERTVATILAQERDPPTWAENLIGFSSEFRGGQAVRHYFAPEPKGELLILRSAMEWHLYQALGLPVPSPARVIGDDDGQQLSLAPLPMDGVVMQADARGRFSLEVPTALLGNLRLGLLSRNGKFSALISLGVGQTRVRFPLNYSVDSVLLFRRRDDGVLEVHRWRSPFFQPAYPAHAAG